MPSSVQTKKTCKHGVASKPKGLRQATVTADSSWVSFQPQRVPSRSRGLPAAKSPKSGEVPRRVSGNHAPEASLTARRTSATSRVKTA